MRRLLILAGAQLVALCLVFSLPWVIAQTTPVWCEVFVDCTGSGNKVSGQDWNNARALYFTSDHTPQRTSANCAAESGGIQNEICTETGPPRKIFVCGAATCGGSNWQEYASQAPLTLISGVVTETGIPPAMDTVTCTNTNHVNASGTAKTWTLCDPAILNPITSFSSGNTLCFQDNFGAVMTITPQPTHSITLVTSSSVVDKAAGASIISSGTRGDECCMQAIGSTQWLTRTCKGFS